MSPRQKFDRYFLVLGAGRHRKFVRFTDSERCAHFLGVLPLAAQSPLRGYLLIADVEEVGPEEVGPEEVSNEAGGGVTVKVAESAIKKLKRVGILERDEEAGAWFVHDWWDVNPEPRPDPTNAERQAALRARRNAARNGPSNAESNGSDNGPSNAPVTAVPSREPACAPSREVEVEGEETASLRSAVPAAVPPGLAETVERLCQLMSTETRSAHGTAPGSTVGKVTKSWRDACHSMLTLDEWTADQIEYAIRWVCRHKFWTYKVRSMTRLRQEMPQVVIEIKQSRERGGRVVPIGRKQSPSDLWNAINGGMSA